MSIDRGMDKEDMVHVYNGENYGDFKKTKY